MWITNTLLRFCGCNMPIITFAKLQHADSVFLSTDTHIFWSVILLQILAYVFSYHILKYSLRNVDLSEIFFFAILSKKFCKNVYYLVYSFAATNIENKLILKSKLLLNCCKNG